MPEYEGYWDCKRYREAAKWTRLWLAWLMCNWEAEICSWSPSTHFFMPHCSLQTKSKKMQAWSEQDPSYWNSQPPRSSAVYLISCEAANGSCCAGIKSIMAQQINAGPNKLWLYYLMQNLKKKKKSTVQKTKGQPEKSENYIITENTACVCVCVCF